MHTHLDLTDLRLLAEAMLSVHPETENPEGLPAQMDPLLDKVLAQAHAQIEETSYCLDLTDEETQRIRCLLSDILDEALEDGDLILIGRIQELLDQFIEP